MKGVARIGTVIPLALVQLLFAVPLPAQQLKLGELQLIYTEDEIPIRYDGSLSTLRKHGEMHFFHSFGREAPIPHITGGEDLHADAAYCTALEKYLLAVQTHGAGKLLLFSSSDGLDWSLETTIDKVSNGAIQPYSAFVDFDGPSADCHTVDEDFYIYFPRKGPDHDHDHMYCRRIIID